ncbi:hypothetical protein RRG08_012197 [Elysia crispata]|uniref:Uncharacterized protein n=1 Tax=Elysia crispata TaxID=231223 RepID=A0AAE1AKH9_9GAST|nr:hypothetical protein RRG08_012197 [Elysia crispata]
MKLAGILLRHSLDQLPPLNVTTCGDERLNRFTDVFSGLMERLLHGPTLAWRYNYVDLDLITRSAGNLNSGKIQVILLAGIVLDEGCPFAEIGSEDPGISRREGFGARTLRSAVKGFGPAVNGLKPANMKRAVETVAKGTGVNGWTQP